MPNFDIKIEFDHTKVIGDQMRARMDAVVRKTALDIEADAKQAIQSGDKSGRVYGAHQASAPGEAPATDLGTLVNSIQMVDDQVGDMEAAVVASAEYAAYLEFGTSDMSPRPFMMPAVQKAIPKFEAAAKKIVSGG